MDRSSRDRGQEDMAGGLEEFIGAGGGKGLFKVPAKGAVMEGRPVSVDLRPRPLRMSRFNRGACALLATDSAVWAGLDHGIWVWDVAECLRGSVSETSQYTVGEEDAAAFTVLPVHGSSTLCLAVDVANKIVWSGHKDGMVRSWSTNFNCSNDRTPAIKTSMFMWEAHPSAILAIAVTSYGELWTLSQNSSLRVWPFEALAKALSSVATDGTSSAAGTVMSRSYIELKPRVIAACAGSNMVINDPRFLVVEHANGRVWSVGATMAVVWDARTREIWKIVELSANPEGQNAEFAGTPREGMRENDAQSSSSYAVVSQREKNQGGWLQRSRNAVLGAADAVRKVAIAVQGGDSGRRVEALAAALDGSIWVGYGNGMVLQWDKSGARRLEYRGMSAVRCLCIVGTRLWVGFADGRIHVLTCETCQLVSGWLAHRSGVLQMASSGFYVFSLAAAGTIRGWNAGLPGPLDAVIRTELVARAPKYTTLQRIQVLGCTWNVGQERPSLQTLQSWVAIPAAAANLVAVGLQEMEVGAGALALAAAKEVGLGEKGSSANGQWWLDSISSVLGQGSDGFELLGTRQLAGILIGVWVRKSFARYVGDVEAAAVACGFGRALGNKGAVALKMTVFRRMFCAVNSHFAAHAEALARRNADFEHVYSRMTFGPSITDPIERVTVPALSEADFLLWLGDFNYRLDNVSYDHALAVIARKDWEGLLRRDQLRTEMIAGRVFQGLREGQINFPPTYKFDKGVPLRSSPSFGYDSSEKRRVPAYCDRVLFRDSFDGSNPAEGVSLSHPTKATVLSYEASMDVVNSDHKPLRCMLSLDISVIDEAKRRYEQGDLLRTNVKILDWLQGCNKVPETSVSATEVFLEDSNGSGVFEIKNMSARHPVRFIICCQVDAAPADQDNGSVGKFATRGGYGFPQWLQVKPACGIIPPNQSMSVTLRPASLSSITLENVEVAQPQPQVTKRDDKSVILVISIQGVLSTNSTRHRISIAQNVAQAKAPTAHARSSHGNRMPSVVQAYPDILSSSPTTSALPPTPVHARSPRRSTLAPVSANGEVRCASQSVPDLLSSAPEAMPSYRFNSVQFPTQWSSIPPDLLSDMPAPPIDAHQHGSYSSRDVRVPEAHPSSRADNVRKPVVPSNLPDLIDFS